ncbi:14425_t:CDS:2, partial [Racocetra fulgida]
LRQKLDLFEDINSYVDNVKKTLTLKKQQWQNTLASEKIGSITRHIEEIKAFEKKQKILIETVDKEKKEIHDLQTEVSDLKTEENTINERKNFLVMQIDAMKKEIQRQRDCKVLMKFNIGIFKNDPSQPCSFTLDVGETIYTDQIEELVTRLNESRDFYTFVKRMRQAFRKQAQ